MLWKDYYEKWISENEHETKILMQRLRQAVCVNPEKQPISDDRKSLVDELLLEK